MQCQSQDHRCKVLHHPAGSGARLLLQARETASTNMSLMSLADGRPEIFINLLESTMAEPVQAWLGFRADTIEAGLPRNWRKEITFQRRILQDTDISRLMQCSKKAFSSIQAGEWAQAFWGRKFRAIAEEGGRRYGHDLRLHLVSTFTVQSGEITDLDGRMTRSQAAWGDENRLLEAWYRPSEATIQHFGFFAAYKVACPPSYRRPKSTNKAEQQML